jgi:hypothetical protein
MMISEWMEAVVGNRWILAAGTVGFFTVKGLAWLIVPAVVLRWRRTNRSQSRNT